MDTIHLSESLVSTANHSPSLLHRVSFHLPRPFPSCLHILQTLNSNHFSTAQQLAFAMSFGEAPDFAEVDSNPFFYLQKEPSTPCLSGTSQLLQNVRMKSFKGLRKSSGQYCASRVRHRGLHSYGVSSPCVCHTPCPSASNTSSQSLDNSVP